MCLYHSQGKCTMIDDAEHLAKFNHDISKDLEVSGDTVLKNHCSSPDLDRLLVLDLEGKVEILEFPVCMIDAKTMTFIDSFHRFVRPVRMSERRVNEYINGKYGKLGIDRVWRDTAIPFKEVICEFETWLASHNLWSEKDRGTLNQAAFVTCGNWDLKTKVPQQCKDSCIKVPPYFSEWINLKDIFVNFYKIRARGMRSMMNELGIPLLGSHHLGIDDSKNITRVLQRMIADGSPLQITARRSSSRLGNVEFLLENRIK